MSKRGDTQMRVSQDDKLKLQSFMRELSNIENRDIKSPEFLRRVANAHEVRELLKKDAEIKRIMRGRNKYG